MARRWGGFGDPWIDASGDGGIEERSVGLLAAALLLALAPYNAPRVDPSRQYCPRCGADLAREHWTERTWGDRGKWCRACESDDGRARRARGKG